MSETKHSEIIRQHFTLLAEVRALVQEEIRYGRARAERVDGQLKQLELRLLALETREKKESTADLTVKTNRGKLYAAGATLLTALAGLASYLVTHWKK